MHLKSFAVTLLLLSGAAALVAGEPATDFGWVDMAGAVEYTFPGAVFYAEDYGALGDGRTMNTEAIQRAIDACRGGGGGTVTFRGGEFVTGSIYVHSGVCLDIPEGTTILGSEDIADYPAIDTRVAGIEMEWPSALINVMESRNVRITGGGVIDGRGKVFWDSYWEMRREYEPRGLRWIVDYDSRRARMILVQESENVVIDNLTLTRSGFWTVQVLYSTKCTLSGLMVRNNVGGHGPSTDGIDIDSSSYILIENCDVDCNDDDYCLKAGRDADGLRVGRPCEYIVLRGCISRRGGGLISCGSETSGGIRYVLAENMHAVGSGTGIRLKSALNRGGYVEHIYLRDAVMEDVRAMVDVTLDWNPAYSYSQLPPEYQGREIPPHWQKMLERVDPDRGRARFSDIHLSGIEVRGAGVFIRAHGVPGSPLTNFSFTDINARVDSLGGVNHYGNWLFDNVRVQAGDDSPFVSENGDGVVWKAGGIDAPSGEPGRQ